MSAIQIQLKKYQLGTGTMVPWYQGTTYHWYHTSTWYCMLYYHLLFFAIVRYFFTKFHTFGRNFL